MPSTVLEFYDSSTSKDNAEMLKALFSLVQRINLQGFFVCQFSPLLLQFHVLQPAEVWRAAKPSGANLRVLGTATGDRS